MSALDTGIVTSLFVDTLWSNKDLASAGYAVQALCPLCQKEEDGIHHRAWCCNAPEATEARQQLDIAMVARAKEDKQGSRATHMWAASVSANLPLPCDSTRQQVAKRIGKHLVWLDVDAGNQHEKGFA